MESTVDIGSSDLGSRTGRYHCVVSLDKALNSDSASLHPGAQVGTCQFNDGCVERGTGDIPSMA